MPWQNGSGPQGQGPVTGRGMGPCGTGYSFGRRRSGYGRGWANNVNYQPSIQDLEAEKQALKQELADLDKQITAKKADK